MVGRENLAVLKANNKLINLLIINLKIINFLMTMTIMVQKGNLAVFEGSGISETGEALPTKTGLHACNINSYLHEFFEPILIH